MGIFFMTPGHHFRPPVKKSFCRMYKVSNASQFSILSDDSIYCRFMEIGFHFETGHGRMAFVPACGQVAIATQAGV